MIGKRDGWRGMIGAAACVLIWLAVARAPEASSGGISGYTGNPAIGTGENCNACHDQGSAPTVTLTGPTVVAPGATNTYGLRIAGGQRVAGGLGVSASAGGLAVTDPGTYQIDGEIVQNAPRAVDGNGEVQWTFNWTAPLSPGPATIYGAGNSVNGGNGPFRDLASVATLAITVSGGPAATPGEPSGPGGQPLRVTAVDPATQTLSLSYEPACEATDHTLYYGPLGQVAALGWSGEVCAIGTSGVYAGFALGPGSYFFVVVGTRGGDEGSYGRNRLPGGAQNERAPFATNLCGQTQTLTNACP